MKNLTWPKIYILPQVRIRWPIKSSHFVSCEQKSSTRSIHISWTVLFSSERGKGEDKLRTANLVKFECRNNWDVLCTCKSLTNLPLFHFDTVNFITNCLQVWTSLFWPSWHQLSHSSIKGLSISIKLRKKNWQGIMIWFYILLWRKYFW